jgi:hypothetical protein
MKERTDFLLVDCGRSRHLQTEAIKVSVHGGIMKRFRSNA